MSDEVFLKRSDVDQTQVNAGNNIPANIVIPSAVQQALNNTQPQYKYPTETFDLPSKGWFYPVDSPLAKGVIEFKMMTAQEEDILTSQKLLRNGTAITKLIEKLIVTPGVKISNLLLCDYNAIIYFVRRMAYGNDYGPFSITCDACGEKSTNEHVNLSRLETNEINFEGLEKGVNSFIYTLPFSQRTVTFKLLTVEDNDAIDKEITAMQKMSRTGMSYNVTTRLKHVITSIDGKPDKNTIAKFISTELIARDSVALRNNIRNMTPELDTEFNFTCPHCGAESRMELPMTAEFFWPSHTR